MCLFGRHDSVSGEIKNLCGLYCCENRELIKINDRTYCPKHWYTEFDREIIFVLELLKKQHTDIVEFGNIELDDDGTLLKAIVERGEYKFTFINEVKKGADE